VLAVQRRDFKQASYYSGELTKLRETVDQQRAELERRAGEATSSSTQKGLESLQKEYDELRANQKQEQLELFKEIQAAATETLGRLRVAGSKSTSDGTSNASSPSADKSSPYTKDDMVKDDSSRSTAASVLLKELQSEIESVLEVSRIRFGRETTVPSMVDLGTAAASTSASSMKSSSKGEDKEEQRAALERDIQSAVVEEDYATAGEFILFGLCSSSSACEW